MTRRSKASARGNAKAAKTANPVTKNDVAHRQRRAHIEANTSCVVQDDFHFAAKPEVTPEQMYEVPRLMRMNGGGGTGSVTNKSEIGIKVTDFFDYGVDDSAAGGIPQSVSNYFWNVDQNLFENDVASSASRTFCRVRKLEVYVLPQTGLDVSGDNRPNKSNATGMYTVNAQVPGVAALSQAGAGFSTTALAADTQVTNILPQIDTFWKCVLKCNLDKTFKSGTMRPFFASANNLIRDQCLFQMSIVDSTTGASYFSSSDDTFKIRVKVVMHIDQPVATSQKADLVVFRNEDFALPSTAQNGSNYPSTGSQYVQMYCTGKMDAFR